MQEYASRFFLLLKKAIIIDAQEKIQAIHAASAPHTKDHGKSLIREYQKVIESYEPIDLERVKKDRERLLRILKR